MFAQKLTALLGPVAGQRLIPLRSFKSPTCPVKASASSQRTITIKRRTLKIQPTELESKFKMEWPKVTLFGDSITRRSFDVDNGCWGSMIAFKLGNYFDVDFRGFEGYNSKWALELMPKLFPKSYLDKVEIFVPFFGHNDSLPLPMHVSVDEYEQNMRLIVKYLLQNGLSKAKIILMTPSWYHQESFAEYCKEIQIPAVVKSIEESKRYSDAILSIAKDHDISVLDFFDISSKHQPLVELFCDGIHFSQKGAKLLFDNLMPLIEKKIETRFEKPLADLWHATPFDQIPVVAQALAGHRAVSGESN